MASEATSGSLLTVLETAHPEWPPLVAVIKEALRDAERPQWARFVPALEHSACGGWPLLDGAVINIAPRLVGSGVHPCLFFFSSRRRHTRSDRDWSSDVCSSD